MYETIGEAVQTEKAFLKQPKVFLSSKISGKGKRPGGVARVTTDQGKKRKLWRASKKATMSWMKGDLLSKTRRLVGGLATREPVWLKAMEASPPPVFPRSNGNLKKIVLPEDPYVRRFARKHPEAKLVEPNKVSAFIPDPARVYGCRVLELTKNGISEDDAMSVANMEYLAERKEKKKAYKRLKELAVLQDKAPPPKPYLSTKKEMQTQEKKPPTDPPSVRRLVNQLKQQKDVLLQDKPGGSANQDHWIDE